MWTYPLENLCNGNKPFFNSIVLREIRYMYVRGDSIKQIKLFLIIYTSLENISLTVLLEQIILGDKRTSFFFIFLFFLI